MINYMVGGFNLPLWKMMDFVCWDYEIPKFPTYGKKYKKIQTTNTVHVQFLGS